MEEPDLEDGNHDWLIPGLKYVCEVPRDLGRVVALYVRDGKIVASTESGIQMIIPTPRETES